MSTNQPAQPEIKEAPQYLLDDDDPNLPSVAVVQKMEGIAHKLAPAMVLPEALRRKPADLLLVMLQGRELGMKTMQSIQSLYVVKGRVTLSSSAMASLIMSSGKGTYHVVELSSEECKIKFKRGGEESLVSFSIEDAKRAGLVKPGGNWTKYPTDMLYARCLTRGARQVFPDVISGMYLTDEIRDDDDIKAPLASAPSPSAPIEPDVIEAEYQEVTPADDRATVEAREEHNSEVDLNRKIAWYIRQGICDEALAWRFGKEALSELSNLQLETLASWQTTLESKDLSLYFPTEADLKIDAIPVAPYRKGNSIVNNLDIVSLIEAWAISIGMIETLKDLEKMWDLFIQSSVGGMAEQLAGKLESREADLKKKEGAKK